MSTAKAALYRTARLSRHLFAHNGSVEAGTYLSVRYRMRAYNALYRRNENVYTAWLADGSLVGDLYENCLEGFCL